MKDIKQLAADEGLNLMNDAMAKMSDEDKVRLMNGLNFLVQIYRSGVPYFVADTVIAISAMSSKKDSPSHPHLQNALFALQKIIEIKDKANEKYDDILKTPERN